MANQEMNKKHKKTSPETDLDLLAELLNEKKVLRLKMIAKIFKITEKVAMDWCKILEEEKIAKINYPLVGDPKIILIKEEKNEKIEKEKANNKKEKEK